VTTILDGNKYFLIASIVFIGLFSFEIIFEAVNGNMQIYEVSETIDFIYHAVFAINMAIFGVGIFKFLYKLHKRKYIHKLAFENSRAIYIEFDHKERKYICQFTDSFINNYHTRRETQIYMENEFLKFMNEEDQEKFIQIMDEPDDNAFREISLKLPIFKEQLLFVVYASNKADRTYWIAFDITDIESMKKQLALTKSELSELNLASKKVIENTNELITTTDIYGHIVQASNRYCEIFDLNPNKITGTYINNVGKTLHHDTKDWVKEVIQKKITKSVIEYTKNNKKFVISWKNVLINDALGNPKSIISIGEDITKLTELQESLEYQANYNQITQLLNSNGLSKTLKTLDPNINVACFVVDIDNFFDIIDYYGIDIANQLLKTIGQDLKQMIQEKDIISNFIEDQFVIMLINPPKVRVEQLISSLEEQIIQTYYVNDAYIRIKKRVGYALYPKHTNNFNDLIIYAGLASYFKHDTAYNQVTMYQPVMKSNLEKNITLSNRLYDALLNNQIDVHMQFIYDVSKQKNVYVESLARWKDDVLGFVSPYEFFNVARRSSLLEMLETNLVKKSFLYFAKLRQKEDYQSLKLSINLTPEMFLKKGFSNLLNEYAMSVGIPNHDIIVEVSENTFVHNLNICREMIENYKDLGFLIAIDDFGSEYSSLAVLESVSYDIIKIDGSFINHLDSEKNNEIVKMISQIGKIGNKLVIAESVETLEISDRLMQNDIYLQQGYYFHKPQKLI
jgi:diguanylate cyclase (GGDEF)-like protein/PAS domain S-box-containing protein